MKRSGINNKIKNRRLSLHLLLVAFAIVIISFAFGSCKNNHTGEFNLTMSLQADCKITNPGMSSTVQIIKDRLSTYGVPEKNMSISFVDDKISLKIESTDAPERLALLATTTGNLEFWETYEFGDVYSFMEKANTKASLLLYGDDASKKACLDSLKKIKEKVTVEIKKDEDTSSLISKVNKSKSQQGANDLTFEEYEIKNPLFAILRPNFESKDGKYYYGKGPVVGFSDIKDTAEINGILALPEVNKCFPSLLKFMWTMQAYDEKKSMLKLLAVKSTHFDNKAPLDGSYITKASYDAEGDNNYSIIISMNYEGTMIWDRMTKNNIGKSIAITLDGFVYSFPVVQSEISKGHTTISGNFTQEEAEDMVTILTIGKLPYKLKILKSEITELKIN